MKLVIILGFAGTTNFGVRFCTNFILHKILDIFLHTCVSTRKTNLITHFYTVFFLHEIIDSFLHQFSLHEKFNLFYTNFFPREKIYICLHRFFLHEKCVEKVKKFK